MIMKQHKFSLILRHSTSSITLFTWGKVGMGVNYYEHELNLLILTAILHRRHWEAGGSRSPLLIVRLSARSRRSVIRCNERGLSWSATCSDEDAPEILTKVSIQMCRCINESTSLAQIVVWLPYFRFKVVLVPCMVRRCITHGRESKLCSRRLCEEMREVK